MAVTSFPYVSVDGDRKVTAKTESQGFDLLSSSGVIPNFLNSLAVTKISNTKNLSVNTGGAIIYGHRMVSDAAETLTGIGASALPRIDIIALESNENTDVRACRFVIVQGNAGSTPSPPELTQTSSVFQIPLAQILIPGGVADYNTATLTDTRTYTQGRHAHDDQLNLSGHTASRALVTDGAGKIAVSDVTTLEIARLKGASGNIQSQLDGKQDKLELTESRALVADGAGNIATSLTTATEIARLSGVASTVQTQIDSKAAKGWTRLVNKVKIVEGQVISTGSLVGYSEIMLQIRDGDITLLGSAVLPLVAGLGDPPAVEVVYRAGATIHSDLLTFPNSSSVGCGFVGWATAHYLTVFAR